MRGRGAKRKSTTTRGATRPAKAARQQEDRGAMSEAETQTLPLLDADPEVWVLGDSIPYWAGVQAATTAKENLKLPDLRIGWWGVRGLTWGKFRQAVEANVALNVPPKIVFIHLGGNDLVSLRLTVILNAIQRELGYLRAAFPDAALVWVDILDRFNWRSNAYPIQKLKSKLKRINHWGRQQVRLHARSEVVSMDIDTQTPGFYRHDGIHLSNVGLEFYLDYIRDTIVKLKFW